MKKFKFIVSIFLILILTSCSNGRPEDITELIEKPKQEEPIIKGEWEVCDIKNTTSSEPIENIKIGDKLYIDKDIVAMNNEYALPPRFSSKYVDLKDYLQSRSIAENIFIKDEVAVINASQGQLFSRDFIRLSDKKIFFISDDKVIVLKKLKDTIDRKVYEKYSKKSIKERSKSKSGEEIEQDVSLLIGVREKIENYTSKPYYNYYTYCVRIDPEKLPRIEKAENIYFPKKEEFWRLRANININNGQYDNFQAYPVKKEEKLVSEDMSEYTYENSNMDMKINFVDENNISFDYSLVSDSLPIIKYATVKTDELKDNSLMTINEYTGNNKASESFQKIVHEQAKKNFDNIEEDKINYDYTNFGLVRNQGLWILKSTYYTDNDKKLEQKSFVIDIGLREDLINKNNQDIKIDQIKSINSQVKDYFELINNKYVLIQTQDEILFYKINNGLIDINPKFSIQLNYPSQIIMFEQGVGTYAKKWEDSFKKNNKIIH